MPPPFTSYTPVADWVKAADHPISYPSGVQIFRASIAIPANKPAERGEPTRRLAPKSRWSKRVLTQRQQVHESNAQEIRESASQPSIPNETVRAALLRQPNPAQQVG